MLTIKQQKLLFLKFGVRRILGVAIHNLRFFFRKSQGYDIDKSVILERNLHLDRLFPQGIHIRKNCLIASGVTILSHDHCKRVKNQPLLMDTYIGNRCFIAVNSIILAGVTIGDEVIVGAGSIVTKDVPSNVIVAGNPAKIIRQNIKMSERAELINWTLDGKWDN